MALVVADDVGRLQIAMQDAAGMRVCQRLGNLPAEANDVGRRQVALRGDHRVE